jgi:hypothetical protein
MPYQFTLRTLGLGFVGSNIPGPGAGCPQDPTELTQSRGGAFTLVSPIAKIKITRVGFQKT